MAYDKPPPWCLGGPLAMVSPQHQLVLVPPPRPSRLPTGSSALKEVSTGWWPRGLLFESVLILSPGILSPVVFFEACSGGIRTRNIEI